jgi:undecaprenyl phosphate-alpha-L-ara4FN deformylase
MILGLRIDVDTYRGTQLGVPALCRMLNEHRLQASFFFTLGPDNMGRHVWRLLRPAFLKKMLRTNAARLYGWDILLKGVLWPGPVIGERLQSVLCSVAEFDHEIGFHAWDHHQWQTRLTQMGFDGLRRYFDMGLETWNTIFARPPDCSAAPAWQCTESALLLKECFPFRYNSDCRGTSIFYPEIDNRRLSQPQIPTTLPTYDETIGLNGLRSEEYNEYLLKKICSDQLNVLTIHAEVEGIACANMFSEFLQLSKRRDIQIVPLGKLLPDPDTIPIARIIQRQIPRREGWTSFQKQG